MSLASPGSAVEGGTAMSTISKTKITKQRVKGTLNGLPPTVKLAPGDQEASFWEPGLMRKEY
jgi:hypothetical protein